MIKAVFFDLYQTLVRYEPPREEIESEILRELGVKVSPEDLSRPLVVADEFIYNEIARRPLSTRSRTETAALYAEHQEILLREAGVKYDKKLVLSLLDRMQKSRIEIVLFDDVKPALDDLKKGGLILGLISNVEQDTSGTFDRLGLRNWLEILVTSQDAGASKPKTEIFRYALRRAGVQPAESIYVGDQYQVDVVGSRSAGMKGILLDRTGHHQDITDCPRISSLTEVVGYI